MQDFILHKNIKISFSTVGKGSTVVLLHGFLENATMWDAVSEVLSKSNRVVSIDLLGHGQTECLGYVHTMEMMAEAVAAVLKHLRIRKSVFIGHSMGGYVALAYAEKYPDNVKGLCLMNSTAKADSNERVALRAKAIEAVKTQYKSLVRLSMVHLFRPKNRTLFKEEIKAVKAAALATPLQGYIAAQEGMKIRRDREVLLHFSPYKKLMIVGKKDPVLSYDDILNEIKGTDVALVEFPDGHMSHIENKDDLIIHLHQFVKNC